MKVFNIFHKRIGLRTNYRTYLLTGDNVWENSITWYKRNSCDNNFVCGWVPIRPKSGDRLAVKMESGRYASYVFTKVELCDNPRDMFFSEVAGPLNYMLDDEIPSLACDSENYIYG